MINIFLCYLDFVGIPLKAAHLIKFPFIIYSTLPLGDMLDHLIATYS